MSAIVGISLFILGAIGITSVIELFDLQSLVDEDKIISNWVVIALALVAPLYALVHLPKIHELNTQDFQTNKFF